MTTQTESVALATELQEVLDRFANYDTPAGDGGHESPNVDYFHSARSIIAALETGTDPHRVIRTELAVFLPWLADRCASVWSDPELAIRLRKASAPFVVADA